MAKIKDSDKKRTCTREWAMEKIGLLFYDRVIVWSWDTICRDVKLCVMFLSSFTFSLKFKAKYSTCWLTLVSYYSLLRVVVEVPLYVFLQIELRCRQCDTYDLLYGSLGVRLRLMWSMVDAGLGGWFHIILGKYGADCQPVYFGSWTSIGGVFGKYRGQIFLLQIGGGIEDITILDRLSFLKQCW